MSIFQDLKPYNRENRNVFDVSHSETFSTKPGICLPVSILHTSPDSHYKIDTAGIIRTESMQKANFTSINADIDFFFVPYRQLWSSFPAFYYGREDKQSNPSKAVYSELVPTVTPTFNYYAVAVELFRGVVAQTIYRNLEQLFNQLNAGTWRLVNSFGRFRDYESRFDTLKSTYFGSRILNSDITSQSRIIYVDVHNRICAVDMVRQFDMLGYGNLWPLMKPVVMFIDSWFNWLVTEYPDFDNGSFADILDNDSFEYMIASFFGDAASYTHFQNSFNSVVNYIVENNRYKRIFNVSGSGDTFEYESENVYVSGLGLFSLNVPSDYFPNPFAILANFKIWSDFYRSGQYDTIDYSFFYNIDYYNNPNVSNIIEPKHILFMLIPNYHLFKRDVFTGGYPNAQFGDVAVAGLTPEYSSLEFQFEDVNGNITQSPVIIAPDRFVYTEASGNDEPASIKNNASVSALAIRQALAIQKWKESILRAGNRERDLLQAMFGVHSRYIGDKYVDYVASFRGRINVNPVASTAETENISLGELGAYAVGTIGGKEFDFSTNEFGVLIGVMYVMPEVKYENYGFDPFNIKTESTDYYNPAFQNLGLAPVTSLIYNLFKNKANDTHSVLSDPVVLEYLTRYYEHKTNISRVHQDFYNSRPLSFSKQLNYDTDEKYDLQNKAFLASMRGSDANMVSVRDSLSFNDFVLQSLYVNPNVLDTLFTKEDDGTFATDQFKCELSVQVKAVLPMSVDGLPNL